MASVKLKSGDSSTTKEDVKPIFQSDKLSFSSVDTCIVFLSIVTYIVDLSTDIILVVNYFNLGHINWAIGTLLLILLPASIVQLFSMRWYIVDESKDKYHWIAHIFLLGILYRYIIVLKTGSEARKSGDAVDYQRLFHQQSDICMLHLFESFMESAPQLVLQLYVMATLDEWYSWTAVSAAVSLGSLAWAVAAYTRAMRCARPDKKCISWPGLALQATWRAGMITARIAALLVFALGFQTWIFLLLGIHWLGMTVWVITQKTDFCPTQWEERLYNCVVGVIYCFCFFNLHEGRSRQRALTFYAIVVSQNLACLALFIAVSSERSVELVAMATIIGGTLMGVVSMLLYYRFFHPSGPIGCDVERSLPPLEVDKLATLRSLKHHFPRDKDESLSRKSDQQEGEVCTDKKQLLTHWASGQTLLPHFHCDENEMDGIEVEELEATMPAEGIDLSGESMRLKRRGICSPAEIVQQLDEDREEEKSKRRALEPEMQVELELSLETDRSELSHVEDESMEKKDEADNIQAAVQSDDSPSEILSAPSEVLSMHDYENICAVNIARETWGLRSWQGYCDIETWLHDDSVVRDRRRDTLSTVTSVSSGRSGAGSPPPLPCRRPAPARSRQDDYLDTLVDDLASIESDFDTVFVARPYVVDQHGMFFPIVTLDTIVEEAEETNCHSSASTLVATIDEIRSRDSISTMYNSQENLSLPASRLSMEEVLFLSKLEASPEEDIKTEKKRNKPRRKVSLLREKFEMKKNVHFSERDGYASDSNLTAVYSESSIHGSKVNILESVKQESKPVVCFNKENVTPTVTSKKSILKIPNTSNNAKHTLDCSKVSSNITADLKTSKPNFSSLMERRSAFLKQVLSPPKLQHWVKKGSLSPKSKIVPTS